jgi:hypothetical protein
MTAAGDHSDWDNLFHNELIPSILIHVISTWEQMDKPAHNAHEDAISLKLFSALVNGKERHRHAFLIRYQDVEVDTDLSKAIGRKDIVFFPSNEEDIYFCLEAKRLNALVSGSWDSLADEYVKEGMQRFVDGKYSRFVRHGGMLAYVLDGDIDRAMINVANNLRQHQEALRMDPPGELLTSNIRPTDPNTKETRHRRPHETTLFRIHHLFVTGDHGGRTRKTPALRIVDNEAK